MDVHHRKIDLQSSSDLTYLFNNIKAAAKEKLDLAIPPSAAPEGEDAYRSRVEELVQGYLLQTFRLALPNLTLNGLDPSPTFLHHDPAPQSDTDTEDNGNYEPYDPRLAEKLRSLYADFELQSTRVAELRREGPGAAARRYMERLEEELTAEKKLETERGVKGEEVEVEPVDIASLERKQDVEQMWGRGTQGLGDLGTVPGILARLERAGRVAEVVEGS